jgi:pyruvate formate lyase activating enzyme
VKADCRVAGYRYWAHWHAVYPERLQAILPKLDWIGFDVKADFADYEQITAIPRSGLPAWRSLQAVLHAVQDQGLAMEIRTTWHPQLHQDSHLIALAHSLVRLGIQHWVLQPFRQAHVQTDQQLELGNTWVLPTDALLQRLRDTGLTLEVR